MGPGHGRRGREAKQPRIVVTTTPKPVPHVVDLVRQAESNDRIHITTGSMLENRANLSELALRQILGKYEGTRVGQQEIEGILLTDVEGALWKLEWIERNRMSVEEFEDEIGYDAMKLMKVTVDPAITNHQGSDETGIIVAGADVQGRYYVFDDATVKASAKAWTSRSVELYHEWQADEVVVESNQGGDVWVEMIVDEDDKVPARKVHASISKRLRAEPIARLYEQNRVVHVGGFPRLEDQMTTWVPLDGPGSPDRIDALVWNIAEMERELGNDVVVPAVGIGRKSPWAVD